MQSQFARYCNLCLIFAYFALAVSAPVFADDEDDAWPEMPEYDNSLQLDPTGAKAEKLMQEMQALQDKRTRKATEKKKWQVWKKDPATRPLSEERIINVGPREYAPVADPLLPLSVPFELAGRVVPVAAGWSAIVAIGCSENSVSGCFALISEAM